MDKFLNFDNVGFVSADILYIKLDGGELLLCYDHSTELSVELQSGSATAADKSTIEAALLKIWSQGYTDSVIDVSLSSPVTAVFPQ